MPQRQGLRPHDDRHCDRLMVSARSQNPQGLRAHGERIMDAA
ncbi:hypothetical protein AB4090_00625 [Acidithiobacillus sp. IBUN Pt1247-S3]